MDTLGLARRHYDASLQAISARKRLRFKVNDWPRFTLIIYFRPNRRATGIAATAAIGYICRQCIGRPVIARAAAAFEKASPS